MQKKTGKKPSAYAIAFLAVGAVAVLYTLIFGLAHVWDYIIAAGVMILVGRIVFIMAQGLDVTQTAPVQQTIPKTGDAAVDTLVEKGQSLLAEIRQENSQIPDADLTAQMDQLEDVANRIFHTVAEQPGKAPQIRRFMDYYLPALYEDDMLDLSTDIEVMEAMLKQDGLVESGLKQQQQGGQ